MPRRRARTLPDPIDVVEAAYDLERDDRDWLRNIALTIRPLVEGDRGICIADVWTAHIAAARRLRDALRGARHREDGVEAGLTPSGTIEHAEGEVTGRSAREALREAVTHAEAARGRLRRHDPHRATEAWPALLSGRWSLVDRYERGGRRYVVARRNEHGLRDPRALSPRERAVVQLVVLGTSNKLIAYELGITASGVATHLTGAMRKLGVTTRIELIRLARTLGT